MNLGLASEDWDGTAQHVPLLMKPPILACILSIAITFHKTCLPLLRPPGTLYIRAFSYLSKLQFYCLWQRPLSACGGGKQHLWLKTRDRRSCPRFLCVSNMSLFFQLARCHVIDALCSICDMACCQGGSQGSLERRECKQKCLLCMLLLLVKFTVTKASSKCILKTD